jgi:hypothetical protein
MNLRSCYMCGVVLDMDMLPFPKLIENPDGTINDNLASWDGDRYRYVPKVNCPVCHHEILKTK